MKKIAYLTMAVAIATVAAAGPLAATGVESPVGTAAAEHNDCQDGIPAGPDFCGGGGGGDCGDTLFCVDQPDNRELGEL